MALELKIISPSEEGFVKQIIWNADEIAAEVESRVGYYKNLVYTDDQIVEAKKDRASLNKFISALKAKDREIKSLCLQPYEEFHNKMLKIISLVEEPVALIDRQVKDYEDTQKSQKLEAIQSLFDARGFQSWLTLERIMNPKWLNKSYSLRQVEYDLISIQRGIGEDIFLINQMGDGQQAALREYERTLDKAKAVEAAHKYIEARQAEQRIAEEARKNQEEIDKDLGIADSPRKEEQAQPATRQPAAAPEVKKISFAVWVTMEQLKALNRCLKENGIRYEQIR